MLKEIKFAKRELLSAQHTIQQHITTPLDQQITNTHAKFFSTKTTNSENKIHDTCIQ